MNLVVRASAVGAVLLAAAAVIPQPVTPGLTSPPLATSAAGFYGNPKSAAPYWQQQTIGDCVEQSVRVAMDEVEHRKVVTESSMDKYAEKINVFSPAEGTYSSNWPELISHYGARYTGPSSMSKARLDSSLAAGDAVIVTLNAETIWNPQGYVTSPPRTYADHALVVTAVNEKTGAVTLSDGGIPTGNGETVSWSLFSKAWATSFYQAVVVFKSP